MKKIGILTLHGANNFGAVLQNYALQKSISRMGYQCETIDYRISQIDYEYKNLKLFRGKNPVKNIRGLYWDFKNLKDAQISSRKFDEFRNRYITLSPKQYTGSTIATASYDLFIIGSDQVWNNGIIRNDNIDVFTLSFTQSKKAAYAASCGNIKSLVPVSRIKQFDYVTVRENDLCDYLVENGISAKVVCDPTILLTKEDWEDLISETPIDHSEYVYLYYIDSGKNDAANIAKVIAKQSNKKVFYSRKMDKDAMKCKYGTNRFSDGPLDFIKEIACADFVVVSSFHGVVFSIIMEKNFITLLHESTGSRVQSLLKNLGLQDRIVRNLEDYQKRVFPEIDYSKVTPIIQELRTESLAALREICNL